MLQSRSIVPQFEKFMVLTCYDNCDSRQTSSGLRFRIQPSCWYCVVLFGASDEKFQFCSGLVDRTDVMGMFLNLCDLM